MKSKIVGMNMLLRDNRYYPFSYNVILASEDGITEELAKSFQYDINTDTWMLTPIQMEWLIRHVKENHPENIDKVYNIQWYKYGFQEYFPILCVDGETLLNYSDINMVAIDDKVLKEEKQMNEYIEYIRQLTEQMLECYPDYKIEGNWLAYDLFAIDMNISLRLHKVEHKKTEKIKSFDVDKYNREYVKERAQVEEELEETRLQALIPEEEILPFEYDRSLPRLIIPRNANPPNFKLTLELLQSIQDEYGLHMRLSTLEKMRMDYYRAKLNYEDEFKILLELDSINSNKRKFDENHPHFKVLRIVGENPHRYKSKTGNISFTKPVRVELLESIKNSKGVDSKEYILLSKYNHYLDIINGPLQIGKPIFSATEGIKVPDLDYERNLETDRLKFRCNLNLVKTNRITTSNPNIQGQPAEIKSTIVGANDHRRILTLDITAQEVMILIFGILENKRLKELVLTNKDPYKSFAICAGLCEEDTFTQELKDLVKVPVLSVMNGKSEWNIMREMKGNEHTAKTILNLINNDPGYKKIVKVARDEEKKVKKMASYNVVRRGLFGTEKTDLEKSGSAYTQSLNSNFQMTASEIISYSLTSMIIDLKTGDNKYGLSLDQLTPLVSIYDEVIFEYDEDVEEKVLELVQFYLCPQVSGWLEMSGDMLYGTHYIYG